MHLYKYRGLSDLRYIADILCHQRLYCAPYSELNDPFEGFFYYETRILEPCGDYERLFRQGNITDLVGDPELRVCSLSSDPWEVRMWALYADSCKGVVIEIDFPEGEAELHKVKYSRKLPSFLTTLGKEDRHLPLTYKTAVWEYESEYRVISDSEFWNITGMISRIIVGPRCSKDDRAILQKLVPANVEMVDASAKDTWQAVVSKLPKNYREHHGSPRSTQRKP